MASEMVHGEDALPERESSSSSSLVSRIPSDAVRLQRWKERKLPLLSTFTNPQTLDGIDAALRAAGKRPSSEVKSLRLPLDLLIHVFGYVRVPQQPTFQESKKFRERNIGLVGTPALAYKMRQTIFTDGVYKLLMASSLCYMLVVENEGVRRVGNASPSPSSSESDDHGERSGSESSESS